MRKAQITLEGASAQAVCLKTPARERKAPTRQRRGAGARARDGAPKPSPRSSEPPPVQCELRDNGDGTWSVGDKPPAFVLRETAAAPGPPPPPGPPADP